MMRECKECGMLVEPGEYHPYAACLMFKACGDASVVRANLVAVLAEGYERAGEIHAAISDDTKPFYAGILAALSVVSKHDQETIFREIVKTVDVESLITAAKEADALEWSGLRKYGYC
jgi:hypothetical protein